MSELRPSKLPKLRRSDSLRKPKPIFKPLQYCEKEAWDDMTVKYAGWSGGPEGTGFISEAASGLAKEQIPNLKLKWAFGFEGGTITRNKVSVIGDYIIFGKKPMEGPLTDPDR